MENSHYWILRHKTPVRGIVGEQCPSPFPNSALHAGLGFSFPYTIRPSPLMTTISHLDSLRTHKVYFPTTRKADASFYAHLKHHCI